MVTSAITTIICFHRYSSELLAQDTCNIFISSAMREKHIIGYFPVHI